MEELKQLITNYEPYNEQEAVDKETMLWYLEVFGEKALLRECFSGHFTASILLFNHEHTKVLMCNHLIDKSWAWLGGHADGIADLKAVALREVNEEAGISNYHLINDGKVAALTCLLCNGHVKRGKYVSTHIHLDIAFVGEADEKDELVVKPDENSGLQWIKVNQLKDLVSDKWRMQNVYQKLIDQFC